MGNSGIYTITNLINNKVYVGYTNLFYKRKSCHFRNLMKGKHNNTHLQNAFDKYGIKNFKFEVLEECNEEFLTSQENYWCNLLNTHDRDYGYNINPTAPTKNVTNSIETRKKISNSLKGNVPWIKGKFHTEETKLKLKEKRKFYKHSEETKRKISKSHKNKLPKNIDIFKKSTLGRKRPKEERDKISDRQKRPILQYDMSMNFIKEFPSVKDAVIELGLLYGSEIARCANNKNTKKSAFGYKWLYKDEKTLRKKNAIKFYAVTSVQ